MEPNRTRKPDCRQDLADYERYLDFFPAALAQPTSRAVAEHILRGVAELNIRYPDCTGCLGIHGVLAGSDGAEPTRCCLPAA